MRRRWPAMAMALTLVAAACGGGGGQSPSGAGATASGAATASGDGGASPSDGGASPSGGGGTATGSVVLSGWQATGDEGTAVENTVTAATEALPNLDIEYVPVAGDYRQQMITNFASGDVPDVHYVNADYIKEWIDEGFIQSLDEYISRDGYDTSAFFPGYLDVFKGEDGQLYGLPKDGNTIAMAYNTELVDTAPTTLDELLTAAEGLKGQEGLTAPMCLNPGLDRGLAFIYAQGGSLLSEDGSASAIDTAESTQAVQWYLDLFKNELGMTASDLGSGWCGEALGKGQVGIIFEGGWLDPFMTSTFPDIGYEWAEMPTGSSGEKVTLSYTVSYSLAADAENPDGGWELLKYLVSPEGMEVWTEGGVALPSRDDVPVPEGKDVLAQGSEYARPGSGFMPGYVDVQKAFQDAATAEIAGGSFAADPVIQATKGAIETALGQ